MNILKLPNQKICFRPNQYTIAEANDHDIDVSFEKALFKGAYIENLFSTDYGSIILYSQSIMNDVKKIKLKIFNFKNKANALSITKQTLLLIKMNVLIFMAPLLHTMPCFHFFHYCIYFPYLVDLSIIIKLKLL